MSSMPLYRCSYSGRANLMPKHGEGIKEFFGKVKRGVKKAFEFGKKHIVPTLLPYIKEHGSHVVKQVGERAKRAHEKYDWRGKEGLQKILSPANINKATELAEHGVASLKGSGMRARRRRVGKKRKGRYAGRR